MLPKFVKDKEKNKLWLFDIIFLLIFSAVPFLRVGLKGIIRPLDSAFPLYPLEYFNRLSSWYETGAYFGNDGAFTSIAFKPFYVLPAFLDSIGLTANLVNRITYISYFFVLGLSAYYMTSNLITIKRRTVPLISALFYMYNPFITGFLNLGHWYTLLSYAALPFMITFFVKAVKEKKKWVHYSTLIGALSILVIPRVRILPEFIQIIFLYLGLILCYEKNTKKSVIHILKIISVVTTSSIIFNAYWIIPSLFNIKNVFNLLITPPIITDSAFNIPTSYLFPLNIVFLVGYGIPMNEYGLFYLKPTTIILFSLLIGLLCLNYIIKNKTNITKYFLALLSLRMLFIFLITYYPTFVQIYLKIRTIMITPIDLLFFTNSLQYASIPIVISYSYLLGNIINEIKIPKSSTSITSIVKKNISLVCFFIIIITSTPTFIGVNNDFLNPVNVPKEYDDSRNWLSEQEEDFRILVIPHSYWLFFIKQEWAFAGKHDISDIIEQATPVPVVSIKPDFGYSNGSIITDFAYRSLNETRINTNVLDLLNVKYVLVRNDVIDNNEYPIDNIRNTFELERKFGGLEYYINDNYTPIISAPEEVLPIYGSLDFFYQISQDSNIQFNKSIFFFLKEMNIDQQIFLLNLSNIVIIEKETQLDPRISEYINQNQIQTHSFINNTITPQIKTQDSFISNITYTKISPEKYMINITTKKPSFINFNMLYNKKWTASVKDQHLPHYKSNSFSNSWYIEKPGTYNISIEYPSWKTEKISELITLFSLAIFIIYSMFTIEKGEKNGRGLRPILSKLLKKTERLNKFAFKVSKNSYGLLDAVFNPIGVDRWIRYKKIRTMVERNNGKIVLDVGPGIEGLSTFLRDEERIFVLVDIETQSFSKNRENGILADGTYLPLRTGTFELVICLDTLEHIPRKKRQKFVEEMKRVARDEILCSTVMQSRDGVFRGREFDLLFQRDYQRLFGDVEKNTAEHIRCGHPSKSEIESYFPNGKIIGYQNAFNWQKYMIWQYQLPMGLFTGIAYLLFWSKDEDQPPFWGAIITWKK